MTSTLFDYNDDADSERRDSDRQPTAPTPVKPLSVGQVSSLVRRALADGLPPRLRVIGEISNFSGRQHWFFSLKDEEATLACVCFASAARRVGFQVANGLQVVVTGRIDYYDAQGRLQLYADKIEPVGQGALELRFRALCERLRAAGYFDPLHKKPLPVMPRRVAVITSKQAAALQDVINTARHRWPGCQLMLFDVPVQGPEAAPRISAAIHAVSSGAEQLGIDAIILTRGGGSIEDLWAFNEQVVADAVFQCSVPIVAAIGHETDTTIAELVADVRCATPTQAVMTLIPDRAALQQQVHQLTRRLTLLLTRQHELCGQRLRAVQRHPLFQRPGRMLELLLQRLDSLAARLTSGLPQKIHSYQQQLGALAKHLESVGPTNVLGRGYSYTLSAHGRVVRSRAGLVAGDRITTVVADGRVHSTVDSTDANPSPSSSSAAGHSPQGL